MKAPGNAPPGSVVVEAGGRRWVLLGEVAMVVAWCCVHEEELRETPEWQLVFDRGGTPGKRVKANLRKFYPGMG